MTPHECSGCPWFQVMDTRDGKVAICNRWQEMVTDVSRCGDRMAEKFLEGGR